MRRNQQIKIPEVRLIDQNGDQVGVMATDEARKLAAEAGLDLVEISPKARPPVCKIMDYGKFKFEQAKKNQQSKKKQKKIQLKEVKFRPNTDEGDFQVKMKNLRKFIDQGNKVKVTIMFRGRELAHRELGSQMLDRVVEEVQDEAVVEQRPAKMEGRFMIMLLAPKPDK
ncbi:translation initiation factor IF-3 [Marinicella gelatinilytica]|uniref:translation initiation factor IF-3 n=1 Tax=Marinicella gelatinilytica TaxID=2996017 RepID=UPI002260ECC4|nr:translation initiation factor IF-3 [Marinicella gelatinilytica]MCX7543983.1 translation initiation factor IF-3 [Marinicella gelatinilytica]